MKTPYLDNHNDAEMRLNRTVVMYKGRPIYIQGIRGDELKVIGTDLLDSEDKALPSLKEEGWDFLPVQLGYVNFPRREAAYVRRTPARRWKQGLDCQALNYPEHMIITPAVAHTILNQYPSFEKAIERADAFGLRTAFHKDWSVQSWGGKTFGLEYRTKEVGEINSDLEFKLTDKYSFLQEALQEAINHVQG